MPLRKEATRKAFNLVLIFIALFVLFISLYFFMSYNLRFNALNSSVEIIREVLNGNGVANSIDRTIGSFYLVFFSQSLIFIVSGLSLVFALWFVGKLYFIEYKNALVDPLTKLYNKKAVGFVLDREIERAKRFKHPLCIAILDIDFFKKYNDRLGHVAGDRLLVRFAKLMNKGVREIDFVGRIGGEEFILIFPETNLKGSAKVVERMRKFVESTKFYGVEKMPSERVTFSAGLEEFKSSFRKKENFIHAADENLYRAKRSGRNRVVFD